MVLELATLSVIPAKEDDFERAFSEAKHVIAASPGFQSLELQRCVEEPSRYMLLVRWGALEDHTVGFRQSPAFLRWRGLMQPFWDPLPHVLHYAPVDRQP